LRIYKKYKELISYYRDSINDAAGEGEGEDMEEAKIEFEHDDQF
jgi:hypothetical protein